MIIDFRNRAVPGEVDAHLCIVGAGPAGITLAQMFIGLPIDVCVIEAGGLSADPVNQQLCEGDSVGLEFDPAMCRVRDFGGSAAFWGGGCVPLSSLDLEARPWVPESGWPISYDALLPYYARARSVCQLGSLPFGDGTFAAEPELSPAPLDPEVLVNNRFMRSPTTLGVAFRHKLERAENVTVLLHANLLELEASESGASIRSARIRTLGGHAGTVRARYFVLAAGGIENARLLLLSSSVARNGLGNDHDLVGRYFMDHPSVKLGTIFSGAPDRFARAYALPPLSAGAVPVPQICLSAAAQARRRLLNARAHPVSVEGEVPDGLQAARALRAALLGRASPADLELKARIQAALGGSETRSGTGELHGELDPEVLWRIGAGLGDIARALGRRAARRPSVEAHHIDLVGFFEQAPNRDSRVLLGEARDALGQRKVRIDWRLTPLDGRSQRESAGLFGAELARAWRGRWQPERWVMNEEEAPRLRGTAHHHGTTRMAADPHRGVVDLDGRVHGVHNLYVAGSSVFPTSGWAFPTFTIVALSLRLGDHLIGRIASRARVAEGAQADTPVRATA